MGDCFRTSDGFCVCEPTTDVNRFVLEVAYVCE